MPLHPPELPAGATFKGFEPYVVQELLIHNENTRYLRARYELAEGGSVLAPFPTGVLPVEGGHFGANLVAYILDQYHHAQVTEPLLLEQLWEYGIDITAGQHHRILTADKDHFHQEKAEVLAAGLAESSYIGTDDTGARHQGHNGYCTALGNDLFAYFESSDNKSRLNFLQVLHGPQGIYAINETTLTYWERQQLPVAVRVLLTRGCREFVGEAAWTARLAALAITDKRHVRIVTEGALLGGLIACGVSPDLVVLSDGAPQFVVLVHAACWIHADRPLAKLVPHNEEHRQGDASAFPVFVFYPLKDLFQERLAQCGLKAFLGDTQLGGMTLQQRQCLPPERCQILCRISICHLVRVFAEGDIQLPVQIVLDAPMPA